MAIRSCPREISLKAATGSLRSRGGVQPSSIRSSTRAVVPTFIAVAHSERLASPLMTCRRRYLPLSAWGSSRVLKRGRWAVVLIPMRSSKKSARWESWKPGWTSPPLVSMPTLPAPQKICRVTKKGMVARITVSRGMLRGKR